MDKYAVGDIVKLKKPHPCGCMVPRKLVEKNDRGLTKKQA